MPSNAYCQLSNEPATRFCTCGGRITVLCDACVATHEGTPSGEIHGYEPICHLDLALTVGLDEYLRKKGQVLGASALASKLQRQEQRQYQEVRLKAQKAAEEYIERLDTLHHSFELLLERFHGEKQAVLSVQQPSISAFTTVLLNTGTIRLPETASLVEAGPAERLDADVKELGTLMERGKGVRSDFADFFSSVLSRFRSEPSPAVDIHPPPVPADVSNSNSSLYVPFSRGPQLAKWRVNNPKLERVQLNPPLDFTNVTVSVVLPSGNMMSCGGRREHSRRAVRINVASGEVIFLADMLTSRGNPGIAYVDNMLFVFGGFDDREQELKSGEKYDVRSNKWCLLRSQMMNSRFQFSPFPHLRTIFIAGGWHTTAVEAFDIPTETFTTLPVVLPEPFAATCLVYQGELIVLLNHSLIRWKLNSRADNSRRQPIAFSAKDSSVMVQISGSKAYYSKEGPIQCEIYELNMASWKVKLRASLAPEGVGGVKCPVS